MKWQSATMKKSAVIALILTLTLSLFPQSITAVNAQEQSIATTAPTSTPAPASVAPDAGGYKIVGYYPGWATYGRNYQVRDMDVSKVTHINYAFADICWNGIHGNPDPESPNRQTWTCQDEKGVMNAPNGTIVMGDPWADAQKNHPGDTWADPLKGNFKQLINLKKANPHLKTLISVGGWSWSNRFSDVAADPVARENFANSAVDFVRKYQFDGVDVDWEYPVSGGLPKNSVRPEDKRNYTLLLQATRDKLNAAGAVDGKHYLLTIASGASPAFVQNTELGELARILDWINIMTYDFNGGWQKISAHNAPLHADPAAAAAGVPNPTTFNVEAGVDGHLRAGVPASKLLLGLPFYGRGWRGCAVASDGQYQQCLDKANVGTWEPSVFDYTDLENNYINRNGYVRFWNNISKVPYVFNKTNGNFITYDDVESLGHKTAYLKSKGLAGAMFWEFSNDRNKPLLNKVYSDLQGGGPGPGPGDKIPPTAPTGLTVTAKTANSVSLSWTASTDNVGVAGYTVAYGSGSVNTGTTSVTVSNLTANTAYTFTVTARDAAGNVSTGASIPATTNPGSGGDPCTTPAWDASSVYTGGKRVSHNGKIYEAKWWTQGDRPDLSGADGVWKLIGNCGAVPPAGTPDGAVPPGSNLTPPDVAPPGSKPDLNIAPPDSIIVPGGGAISALPSSKKLIVGYWHNFENGSGVIRLRDVSPKFDVINVSFAEPTNGPKGGTIGFKPFNATDAEFIADIKYLQSQGKKVIISIGGANGQVQLESTQARDLFVSSMKQIISTYGFNGLDIDFEGHSLYLNGGDTDFRSPTTPVITNLISAVRELHNTFGEPFMVTMAPETFFVQVGYSFYGGSGGADNRAGSYLPVIYALRDILDWLQVQHYNSGPITALDDTYYPMGNADFHVAMVDMVLTGFPVAKNRNHMFPALRPDQVLIGLPANNNAGNGFTPVPEVHKALNYVYKGVPFGGRYKLRNPAGYPGMRGLMTWSINWDKFYNFDFSNSHRAYLDSLGGGGGDTIAPTAPANLRTTGVGPTNVSLAWDASSDNVGVVSYDLFQGANKIASVTGTSFAVTGLTPNTSYTFTVKALDAAGNVSPASNELPVNTGGGPLDPTPPSAPTNVQVTAKSNTTVSLSWTASTDNVGVTGYKVVYGTNSVTVSTPATTLTGLTPNTLYTFTVTAFDAAGNSSTGTDIQVTTDGTPSVLPWTAGTSYKVNDEASFNGVVYICRQPHTALNGWEPPNVPALWKVK
ncbi:glycosyl hydrolase family 18 protein [Paenibacillus sp. 481]|uniref:glycosyl hydrolase family 18 protein n=1 Tax=Paenibacillus sp. 481 TaxID=2835869 RepID=UPI003FA76642